jgi:hypothetical protein
MAILLLCGLAACGRSAANQTGKADSGGDDAASGIPDGGTPDMGMPTPEGRDTDSLLLRASDSVADAVLPQEAGAPPALDSLLPADGEVGAWQRLGSPELISTDAALYDKMDGVAPKFIVRGWTRSVLAVYGQGTSQIYVAIHDMVTPGHAEDIFNYDLPMTRIEVAPGSDNAVVDVGLASGYRAIAFTDRYYIEVTTDEHSDTVLAAIEAFIVAILRQ